MHCANKPDIVIKKQKTSSDQSGFPSTMHEVGATLTRDACVQLLIADERRTQARLESSKLEHDNVRMLNKADDSEEAGGHDLSSDCSFAFSK